MEKCSLFVCLVLLGACNSGLAVQDGTAELTAATCKHGACATGDALSGACDPCAAAVCSHDAYCCDTIWDALCVGEADQFCASVCQTSCSVGPVPIVKLAEWSGQLPAPKGRQVLVLGPWITDAQMSAVVYQEQTDQVDLAVVFDRHELGRFFTVAVTPTDIIVAGSTAGVGQGPRPGNPIGTEDEVLAAAQALARAVLDLGPTACSLEGARLPALEPPL